MFTATHFMYDGVFSGVYGLLIADFDGKSVVETESFSPTLNTINPVMSPRFYHNGVRYENPPQCQFSVISETEISDIIKREILSWLVGRSEFKKLQILQPDFEGYYYNCVFTNVDIIYINGKCHGFRLTAVFDSHYARGDDTSVSLTTGINTVKICNNSDIIDGYTYPRISFTVSGSNNSDDAAVNWVKTQKELATVNANGAITPLENYNICIINKTDDSNRRFIFAGLRNNEKITVDNEAKFISSDIAGCKLGNFNKNWLRLRPGYNELQIDIKGTGEITCPCYAMIGF